MTNRRDFIKQASMLVACGVVGSSILSSCSEAAKKHIGLQLYSLRDDVKDLGIKKVLELVAAMGYVNLELAGYGNGKLYGENPADFKKMVEDLGMKVTSSHCGYNMTADKDADTAWWNRNIETHNTAGIKYMVQASAPFRGEGATLDNVKRYGDYFNEIALSVAAASMSFGYHNHDFEFRTIDDKPIYDYLMEYTSPDHVMFQLDVYWIQRGGYDPVEYMKKYANRIKVLHIKDDEVIGASGKMNFEPIFQQAYANNIKDWYVEVERYTGTPQEDVKKSYDYLNAASYVK